MLNLNYNKFLVITSIIFVLFIYVCKVNVSLYYVPLIFVIAFFINYSFKFMVYCHIMENYKNSDYLIHKNYGKDYTLSVTNELIVTYIINVDGIKYYNTILYVKFNNPFYKCLIRIRMPKFLNGKIFKYLDKKFIAKGKIKY